MLVVESPTSQELPHINCKLINGSSTDVVDDDHPRQKPSSRKACFSFAAYAKYVINRMRNVCSIPIHAGLHDDEFSEIEATFGFTFPPDLRSILQEGLPTGHGFPHWRSSSSIGSPYHSQIKRLLDLPITALCAEVGLGKFWPSQWGARPWNDSDAIMAAAHELARVPTLIPVYATCYISCFPVQAGNPVFLVQEGTILYCGYDLADFFKRQAFVPRGVGQLVHVQQGVTSPAELHLAGLSIIKDQINMQRIACINYDTSEGQKADNGAEFNVKADDLKDKFSMAMWRWADESPRINAALPCADIGKKVEYVDESSSSSSPPSFSSSLSSNKFSSSPSSCSSSSSHRFDFCARSRHNQTSSPSSVPQNAHLHGKANPSSHPLSPLSVSRIRSGQNRHHARAGGPKLASSSSTREAAAPKTRAAVIPRKYLYLHERPLPSRMLTKFTMAAPPWAATQARKIDFWSDLAENYWLVPKKYASASSSTSPGSNQESGRIPAECVDPCIEYEPGGQGYINGQSTRKTSGIAGCRSEIPEAAINDEHNEYSNHWLPSFLEGLADALRQGRWAEVDIHDMLNMKHSADNRPLPLFSDSSYISLDVVKLQSCLQEAGWSAQDTLHMLS